MHPHDLQFIVCKRAIIERIRKSPFARMFRVCKMTLAALEATLHVYRDGDPVSDIPVLAAIARPLAEVDKQARTLARRINALHIEDLTAEVVGTLSETGGGSLPGQSIESRAIALKTARLSAEDLSRHFREFEPPIYGRIARDVFLLDMRTIDATEGSVIVSCARVMAS